MNDFEAKILNCLGARTSPKEMPVTRSVLAAHTGLTDRKLRDAIASLQAQGFPIVSLSKGYFLGAKEEVEAYIRREKSRAITILQKLRNLVPQLGELVDQLTLF